MILRLNIFTVQIHLLISDSVTHRKIPLVTVLIQTSYNVIGKRYSVHIYTLEQKSYPRYTLSGRSLFPTPVAL